MPPPTKTARNQKIYHLFFEKGLAPVEIAARLHLSRQRVSALLVKERKRRGLPLAGRWPGRAAADPADPRE